MNGYTLAGSFNGCIGEYPISQIINIDSSNNTNIYATNEIMFNSNLTKIDSQGFLRIYHAQTITLPTVVSQWISVPDAIVYLLQEDLQWNAQSADTTAHFSLIDGEIAGINTTLGTTTTTANSAFTLATTANATASTALANGITNATQISSINSTIPTLISSNSLNSILNTCNYLPKSGGTLTGTLIAPNITNSTSFIYQGTELASTLTNYMLKAGATMTGRLNFNYALFGDPSPSGVGDRVVLNLGIGTTGYASSIGINTNSYWFSAPTSTNYNWYVNGGNIMSLSSTGTLNTAILQEGGTSLSSKYQPILTFNSPLSKTANTVSIDLTTYDTITARNTAITNALTSYSTTGNDTNYLKLSGGVLTGNLSTNSQITGFTTLNGTTGIFGTLSTTNNTNVAIPAVGNFGGIGDKIILNNGTSTTYPYSIGMESMSLWFSSPYYIKFYINGVNTFGLNSTSTIINNTNTSQSALIIANNLNTYAFMVGGASNTTIGPSGFGIYDANSTINNYVLVCKDGNVGIGKGTTNPTNILQVGNAGRLRIANDATDYSLIGTIDVDGSTNTRIVLSGSSRASPYNGNIEYIATSGNHIFYTTTSTTERMRILNNGNVGIGTNNTAAALDIAPMNYTLMRNGGGTYGISNQLLFSWNGNSNLNSHYHAINTRHSITTNYLNSIDFFIWQVGTATNQINTTQATLSITQPSVFVNVPSVYNYNTQGYGQSLTISGSGTGNWGQLYIYDNSATGTQYTGLLIKGDNANSLCSISSFRQGGTAQIPLRLNQFGNNPIIMDGPLILNGGQFTTNNLNWDMNITQNSANTLAGNINITAYGANGGINFNTGAGSANGTKLHIDPGGYVATAGMLSTTQSTTAAAITGTSGYWLIPIPLVVAGNFYSVGLLNFYNSNNTMWWAGNIVVNTIGNTVAYTTIATGPNVGLNGALVLNSSSLWCIKVSCSNGFNITSGMLLYFKYIC